MVHDSKRNQGSNGSSNIFDAHSDPIAIALKRLHDEVSSEDIPSEFLDLLAQIDRKVDGKGNSE